MKPEESHTEKIAPLKKPLNSTVSVWAHSNGIYSELYTLLPGLCSTKAEGRLSFLCKQLRHVFKRCAFRLSLRIPQKYPGQQQKKISITTGRIGARNFLILRGKGGVK